MDVHRGSAAWTLPEQLVRSVGVTGHLQRADCCSCLLPGRGEEWSRQIFLDLDFFLAEYFLFTKILIWCGSKLGISPAVTVPSDGAPLRPPLWGVAVPQLRPNRLILTLSWQNGAELMFG